MKHEPSIWKKCCMGFLIGLVYIVILYLVFYCLGYRPAPSWYTGLFPVIAGCLCYVAGRLTYYFYRRI